MNSMDLEIKISIYGNRAQLRLVEAGSDKTLGKAEWEDKRDLSQKLFQKIESLLQKRNLSVSDIRKFSFNCDSPYFSGGKRRRELKMEDFDSSGRCGFTAWQTGEIIVRTINFALEK